MALPFPEKASFHVQLVKSLVKLVLVNLVFEQVTAVFKHPLVFSSYFSTELKNK
jgi:hypothetical protein